MKNEQENNQTKRQGQENNMTGNKHATSQTQGGSKTAHSGMSNDQSPSSQKSNISVDNDGRIGKAHDQWNNNTESDKNKKNGDQQNQVRSDKTVTGPEIDAPIYDPEKTEKKIPQMESNKNSK